MTKKQGNTPKMALAPATLKRYCGTLPANDEWQALLKNWRDYLVDHRRTDHWRNLLRTMASNATDWPALRLLSRVLYRVLSEGETDVAINTMNFLVEAHLRRVCVQAPSKQTAVLHQVPQALADFEKCPGETVDNYCLIVPDSRLAEFGVFKGDELSCRNGTPRDGDSILMTLDDELFLGRIYLSSGTPERFTVRSILGGEKIILPAHHLANVLTLINGVYPLCLEFAEDDKPFLAFVDLRKPLMVSRQSQ